MYKVNHQPFLFRHIVIDPSGYQSTLTYVSCSYGVDGDFFHLDWGLGYFFPLYNADFFCLEGGVFWVVGDFYRFDLGRASL